MSRFAFGLRYFLFGLGSALNTGEHDLVHRSDTGLPEFVPRCLCNIDHPTLYERSPDSSYTRKLSAII
jgi:hypothetical protein